jgi:hypothetical protein
MMGEVRREGKPRLRLVGFSERRSSFEQLRNFG